MAGLMTISARLTQETADQFTAAFEASGCETKNQFYELILESYLNPKTKPVEVPRPTEDQLQEIQLKDNEIGRWRTACDLEAAHVEAMGEECRLLSKQLNEAKAQILELSNTPPVSSQVPELVEGQIILTIPPIMSAVLDIEQEIAEKKSKRKWTIGDLLLNNFWESITNGASHPFRIWSGAELTRLAKQIQEVQQNEPAQV